jgi:hypothetical protein
MFRGIWGLRDEGIVRRIGGREGKLGGNEEESGREIGERRWKKGCRDTEIR